MSTYRAISDFYDDEYADLGMLHEDVGFFLSSIRKSRSDVLLLACGTGRAAIPVALAGHRVLGVDIDPAMLAIAANKRDSSAIESKSLAFEQGDLLDWSCSRRFDQAAILFNSFLLFTTLADQDRVLQNAHRHLKKGGQLWIDIFNPDLARIADEDAHNADVRIFHSREINTTVQRLTHICQTSKPQVRETIFEYHWFDSKQKRRTKKIRFELTWFFERELILLLERNGFKIEHTFGDYDGSEITSDSPRVIVQARKS